MKKYLPLILTFILFSSFVTAFLPEDIILGYSFDNTSVDKNTIYDFTGLHNATNNGANNLNGTDCFLGDCYEFTKTGDNAGDYMNMTNNLIKDFYNEITFITWYRTSCVTSWQTIAGLNLFLQVSTEQNEAFKSRFLLRQGSDQIKIDSDERYCNKSGWEMLTVTINSTVGEMKVYRNKSLQSETTGTNFDLHNQTDDIWMGALKDGGITQTYGGRLDEMYIINNSISEAEINETFDNFLRGIRPTGGQVGLTLTFTPLTPLNGTVVNNNTLLNFELKYMNDTALCNLTNNDVFVINKSISTNGFYTFNFNNSFWADGSNKLNITCVDNNTKVSQEKFLIADETFPTIQINTSNTVTRLNSSTSNQYTGDVFIINATFEDNNELLNVAFNMTRNGVVIFDFINESIGSNMTQLRTNFSVAGLSSGVYNAVYQASDAHTDEYIEEYYVSKFLNKLTFETTEENTISIRALGGISSDYYKLKDRYNFEFGYMWNDNEREFEIECDNRLIFLPHSKYKGHFVCWNPETYSGNWIDFEGLDGYYTVKKKSDNEYKIKFYNMKKSKKVFINSIGGLNIATLNLSWYKGVNNTIYQENAVLNSSQTFILNMSRNDNFIQDINVTFTYNGTSYPVTKTLFATFYRFESSLVVPNVEGTFNFSYNVSVYQVNGSQYNFTLNHSQSMIRAQLNITFYDEREEFIITENLTVTIESDELFLNRTTETGNIIFSNLTIAEYTVVTGNENYPRSTRFITPLNETNNIEMYLLNNSEGTDFVQIQVQDRSQNPIENATLTFAKRFNTTIKTTKQDRTDSTGFVEVHLDTDVRYLLDIIHPDFPINNLELKPILTEYVFNLDRLTDSVYNNTFEGISWQISPSDRQINISDGFQEITLQIFDSTGSLQSFGVELTDHTFDCIPTSCIMNVSNNANGGVATVQIRRNESGNFQAHFFFKRQGFDNQYLNGRWYLFALIEGRPYSMLSNFVSLREELGGSAIISVGAAVLTAALVITASQLGIVGLPLILVATGGTAFFMFVQWLSPLVGLMIIFFGVGMYVVMARND